MRVGAAAPVFFSCAFFGLGGPAARAQTIDQLQQLSVEQLTNIEITSITKSAEPLTDAPGSIYVINHDDIVRSGALSIPEMLRLAPNLQVNQISASRYIITARGLSGNLQAQNFTNKLLVLIDGRSVYTPLFSGVYWDMQDVLPDDIDRIEVISGPGATLWGANAVNGVVNIVTRKSSETQGGLVDLRSGNVAHSLAFRQGGTIQDGLTYRFYFSDYIGDDTKTPAITPAHDHWARPQGGFRVDWAQSARDAITLQGDAYSGSEAQPGSTPEDIDGANIMGRWTHQWQSGASLQLQAYFDRIRRGDQTDAGGLWQNTFDVEVQHDFVIHDWNQITWGGGYRSVDYNIRPTSGLSFVPPSQTLRLGNLFVQDSISLSDSVKAIVGLKLESDPYSGLTTLPSVRLSWKVDNGTLLWGAVSRAIRSPTPFDVDVRERVGSVLFLTGNPNFQSETLTAYELGTRLQPTRDLSFTISAFYNVYDRLRSIEITPVTLLPLLWGNQLGGNTYGVEAWANYQLRPWWRISASLTELAEHFSFDSSSSKLLGVAQLGNDPERRASLRSSMDLGADVTLDADLRYVSALPNPRVPAYAELNVSVGWNILPQVRLSVSGFNLIHAHHFEFPASDANAIPRSVVAGMQWRF